MNIVVCIKQVPDTATVRFDQEKGTIVREGVQSIINPPDLHALEAGLSLRDQFGGKVIVLTMGPPQAENALRDALSLGADEAVLLSDRAFAAADTLATTYTLLKAIQKIGLPDLILCGTHAIDGDTAQVGPGLAARLGWPSITHVAGIEAKEDGTKLLLKRLIEQGYEMVEAELPVLITCHKTLNTPRVPSLKAKMRAKKAQIPIWDQEELGAEPEKIGIPGSPTWVDSTFVPAFEAKKEMLQGGPEEQVDALIKRLKESGIL